MRLLIVEENNDMRVLYRIGLRKFKVELLEAATMAEALQQIREGRPDAVLIGDTLPDGDPFELCRQIRSDPETRDIPVAIAVYYVDGAIRRLSREVKADACWPAPVPPREIPKRMEELRQLRRAPSSGKNNGSYKPSPER